MRATDGCFNSLPSIGPLVDIPRKARTGARPPAPDVGRSPTRHTRPQTRDHWSGRPFGPSTPIFGAPTDDTCPGGAPFRDIASASQTPVFGDLHPTSGYFGCPIRGFLHMSSWCIFLGPEASAFNVAYKSYCQQ
ncbi:hypothetical protein C8Q77DRAFT_1110941 [Trametes polyzona]|nr:hypothetical protein C8Q77DRAFT_1110941 [Trametes polyzona]